MLEFMLMANAVENNNPGKRVSEEMGKRYVSQRLTSSSDPLTLVDPAL